MAKVKIFTSTGEQREVEATKEDARWYDELPFTSSNVVATQVTEDDDE